MRVFIGKFFGIPLSSGLGIIGSSFVMFGALFGAIFGALLFLVYSESHEKLDCSVTDAKHFRKMTLIFVAMFLIGMGLLFYEKPYLEEVINMSGEITCYSPSDVSYDANNNKITITYTNDNYDIVTKVLALNDVILTNDESRCEKEYKQTQKGYCMTTMRYYVNTDVVTRD